LQIPKSVGYTKREEKMNQILFHVSFSSCLRPLSLSFKRDYMDASADVLKNNPDSTDAIIVTLV